MGAFTKLFGIWKSHGTRILGFLTAVCAGLPLIEGLVPPQHKPYWGGVNLILGALTIQRGTANARNSTTSTNTEASP
jgi:hypothetical protein